MTTDESNEAIREFRRQMKAFLAENDRISTEFQETIWPVIARVSESAQPDPDMLAILSLINLVNERQNAMRGFQLAIVALIGG